MQIAQDSRPAREHGRARQICVLQLHGLDEITIHSGVTVFGGEIFKDVGKLTISTESGSDAEKYAQDNGFDVAVIG